MVKHKHAINTALVQIFFFFGSQTKRSVCKVWEYSSSAAPPGRIHSHPPSPSRSPYHLPLCSLFLLWLSTVFPHLVSHRTLQTFSVSHLLWSCFLLFFSAGVCWMILKGIVNLKLIFDPFTAQYFFFRSRIWKHFLIHLSILEFHRRKKFTAAYFYKVVSSQCDISIFVWLIKCDSIGESICFCFFQHANYLQVFLM